MKMHGKIATGLVLSLLAPIASAMFCPTMADPETSMATCTDPNSSFSVTYNPDDVGLFGTMILDRNTILFLPDDFSATSNNGIVGDPVVENLNLTLTATVAGFDFGSFSLTERGDYLLTGDNAFVSAHGEMRVRYNETNPPFDEFLSEFDFMASGDLGNGQWSGQTFIDSGTTSESGSNQWLGTDGAVGSQVFLTLQNILNATTAAAGEQAFIQKKTEMVLIEVSDNNPVPVPAAVWLFGSALLSLFGYRKAAVK